MKLNKIKKLLFLIFLTSVYSQSQILVEKDLSSKNENLVSQYKIDNVFISSKNSYVSLLTSERYNRANYSMQRNFIIKDFDGIEYSLRKNEYPIDIIDHNVYTFTEDIDKQQREYVVYDVSNKTLDKKSSLTLSLSSTAYPIKNGDIVITEGGHSGRDWIALYSKDFKKIHEFRPFNEESNINFDANENYIVYVGQIDVDSKIRVALYGSFGNKGLVGTQEINIDDNLILSSVKVVKDKIVILFSSTISGSSQFLVLDNTLKEVNKVSLNERVSYNKIVSNSNNFYLNTSTQILSFDIDKLEKKVLLKKENTQAVKTKKGYRFKGSNIFKLDENYLLLLEAIYDDSVNDINDVELKIIGFKDQSVEQKIKTETSFLGDLKLKKFGNELVLFANNKILVYEKQ